MGLSRCAVLTGFVLFYSQGAQAADEPEALIHQGVVLRQQGEDARAHGYFKRAYDVSHTPRSAAQLGLCEYAIELYLDSESHLSEALATRDPWIQQNRATLESSIATVRGHLGRLRIDRAPIGTTVELGSRPALPLRDDGIVWVDAGASMVRLSAPRHEPMARRINVAAGATLDIDLASMIRTDDMIATTARSPNAVVAAVPVAPAAGDPAEDTGPETSSGGGARVAGLVIAGVGVGLGVAGALVYASGTSKLNAIKSDAQAPMPRPYDPNNGNWQTLRYTGIGLVLGGVAALTTGIVVYLVNRRSATTEAGNGPSNVSFAVEAWDAYSITFRGDF